MKKNQFLFRKGKKNQESKANAFPGRIMNVFVKKQKKRKGGEKKKITRVDGQGEKKEAGETHRVVEVFAGGFCRSRRARARCGGGTPGADAGQPTVAGPRRVRRPADAERCGAGPGSILWRNRERRVNRAKEIGCVDYESENGVFFRRRERGRTGRNGRFWGFLNFSLPQDRSSEDRR